MSDYKVRLGRFGENLAADFLTRRGWKIIDRNFYTAPGEIDLIARQGDELLFVEVKTRTDSSFGYPEQAVGYMKLNHLHQAIQIYLRLKSLHAAWQLCIISVELNRLKKTAKINLFDTYRD